jgi:hypothetical protein
VHAAFDVDAVAGVVEVDLGPVDPRGAEWSGREVAAAELRRWLHQHASAGRIVVAGARVLGPTSLDLADLRLTAALGLRDCLSSASSTKTMQMWSACSSKGASCAREFGSRAPRLQVVCGTLRERGSARSTGSASERSHASFGGPVVATGWVPAATADCSSPAARSPAT